MNDNPVTWVQVKIIGFSLFGLFVFFMVLWWGFDANYERGFRDANHCTLPHCVFGSSGTPTTVEEAQGGAVFIDTR